MCLMLGGNPTLQGVVRTNLHHNLADAVLQTHAHLQSVTIDQSGQSHPQPETEHCSHGRDSSNSTVLRETGHAP
jgi:hypothetical protein